MTMNNSRQCVLAKGCPGSKWISPTLALATLVLWGLAKSASAGVTGQIVPAVLCAVPRSGLQNVAGPAIAAGNSAGGTVGTKSKRSVSIVVGTTNTIIVYDHWEDGYKTTSTTRRSPAL